MIPKDEEYVKELSGKLEQGELSSKEALKELKRRGLVEQERWEIILWVIYIILWLPLNLKFSDQLSAIHFPVIIIYILLIFLAVGTYFVAWVAYSHRKRGRLRRAGETVTFYRKGLYRVMRHPGAFGGLMWPVLLPVILSAYVPFTILSVVAIIVMIVYLYIGILLEEKLSIRKWGDIYRQYMKEVPRFNFILGLQRLRKRQK